MGVCISVLHQPLLVINFCFFGRGGLKPRGKPFPRVLLTCLSLHFLNLRRASPAETHRQEAGTHGDRPGEAATARPAAGAPAEGAGRSQKPTAPHTR